MSMLLGCVAMANADVIQITQNLSIGRKQSIGILTQTDEHVLSPPKKRDTSDKYKQVELFLVQCLRTAAD